MLSLTPEQTAVVQSHLREVGTAMDQILTANGKNLGWWAYHRARMFADETPTEVLMVGAAYCDDERTLYEGMISAGVKLGPVSQVLLEEVTKEHNRITQTIAARRRKEAHV